MNDSSNKRPGFVEGRVFTIGREGHIYLNDSTVSKHHAEIKVIGGKIHLRDLDSTNGIYLFVKGSLVQFHEGFVHPDQTVAIGRKTYTPRKLLQAIDIFSTG